MNPRKVLLLAHCGEDFFKARLSFAQYLQRQGIEVFVMVPKDNYTSKIQEFGFKVGTTSLQRDNTNPITLLKAIVEANKFANLHTIDIVHSFKFIPNLINTLSNLFSKRRVVLHIAGLGIAFANNDLKYKVIRQVFRLLFFMQFIRANIVIIQNPDDYSDFFFKELFKDKIKVVKGSGVDVKFFSPTVSSRVGRNVTLLCTTRLIWEKGIRELVDAVSLLPKHIQDSLQVLIIGEPDDKNPRAVTADYIEQFRESSKILFLGKRNNIKDYLVESDIFILPSYYREGIPRSILEALACAKPVITTNVPGCNLTVKNGINGYLIEPKSPVAIRDAILEMFQRREDWNMMGRVSREMAIENFSEEVVYNQIVNLYNI